eukprot:TRINITY_DN4496_c1_g1_i2.p1 TRINITY_DN4496_c1_g1~~TRINITY_DN4496_c1_g1_i2.p1  ORF type:complete len:370 (+),score=73.91 TRINITY_DN4496_c1_g1_i2:137-1111(+)
MATELTGEQWNSVIDDLAKFGISSFCLTGGEPSMHPDFVSIVKHMCEATYFNYCTLSACGVGASMITNGDSDVFTAEFCEYLASQGCQVSISLLDDQITAGDLERTLCTAARMVKAGVSVTGNVTLCGANINLVSSSVQKGMNVGIKHFMIMRPMPVGRGKTRQGLRFISMDAATIRSILQHLRDMVCSVDGGTITLGCTTPQCIVDTPDVEDLVIGSECGCGTQTICVDPAGLLRPCTTSAVIGGTVDDVAAALASPEFGEFRSAIGANRPAKCNSCKHKEQCSSGCPAGWVVRSDGTVCDHLVAAELENDEAAGVCTYEADK